MHLISCNKEIILVCNVKNPITELEWLNEIVSKAENDTTGNYAGTIYLETYKENQVFYIDMAIGSGGLAGHWFNCNGSKLNIEIDNPPILTRKKILYTNIDK